VRLKSLKRRIILQTGSPQLTYKAIGDKTTKTCAELVKYSAICRRASVDLEALGTAIFYTYHLNSFVRLKIQATASCGRIWKSAESICKLLSLTHVGLDSKVCVKLSSSCPLHWRCKQLRAVEEFGNQQSKSESYSFCLLLARTARCASSYPPASRSSSPPASPHDR